MKRLYRIFLMALMSSMLQPLFAQQNVGIGTKEPDNSAVLDISSSSKGLLIPRMTAAEINLIETPAEGLMVFQTGENSGFLFFDGLKWQPISSNEARSTASDPNDWSFTGNAPIAGSFVGTTTGTPLEFKVNSNRSGFVNTSGATFYGYKAGESNAGSKNTAIGGNSMAVSTGNNNSAIGYDAMKNSTSGFSNMAIGNYSLRDNLTGSSNLAIGVNALLRNTSGSENVALGKQALSFNLTSAFNVAIGSNALQKVTGARNVGIGYNAGADNTTGTDNVFIGYEAGKAETSSDKLYISNSNTAEPLLYGDFAAKFISIGDIPIAKRDAIASAGSYGLLVKGGIMTEKVKVALSSSADWADYVFASDYKLMPLKEVEDFINVNKHLPNVPSAEEMARTGINVAETSAKLMEKIEELTLYVIDLKKEIDGLKK